jgi:hypothetical protein
MYGEHCYTSGVGVGVGVGVGTGVGVGVGVGSYSEASLNPHHCLQAVRRGNKVVVYPTILVGDRTLDYHGYRAHGAILGVAVPNLLEAGDKFIKGHNTSPNISPDSLWVQVPPHALFHYALSSQNSTFINSCLTVGPIVFVMK